METTSRRAAIASALVAAGAHGVSGEMLAAELGITRVAVNKHVAVLRALGYEIRSTPHVGYRMIAAPDLCIPEEVCPRLTDPLWVSCDGAVEVASTNDEAKRMARERKPEGTLVVAARQVGGRGRFGRVWESPKGGVYGSCILRPPLEPGAIAPLSLVVAVGAARGLASFGVPVGLKWPNDLIAGGRKMGGILLEMAAEADRVDWVVAGCGINVAGRPGEAASSVREFAPTARVADVAAAVFDGIAAAYRQFLGAGFASIHVEYETLSTLNGTEVTVADATGTVVAEGIVRRVAADGALVVRARDGEVRVRAGEVTLRR